jgi:PTS system nitrogen regulatory IIA component
MNISQILTADQIRLKDTTSSKKRALEILSEMLAQGTSEASPAAIFEALNRRERLGSTGLGRGVAIPHGRIAGAPQAIGAVLRLKQGIDYDAPDRQPVDIMFALLVPEQSTDEHLELLSQLAAMFSDERYLVRMREIEDPQQLLASLNQQVSSDAA